MNRRGIAVVEIVYLLLFFLGVAEVVHHFSLISNASHQENVELQNKIETMMIEARRPTCLEEMATSGWIESHAAGMKRLVFVDQSICEE